MTDVRLLAVVEVPQSERVICQAPNCKRPVYKRIHVVLRDGHLTVLGSECFKKLFGEVHSGPKYGSAEGRLLTPEERQLLVENTDRLIAQFEVEHKAALERARIASERQAQAAREREAAMERQRVAAEERARLAAEQAKNSKGERQLSFLALRSNSVVSPVPPQHSPARGTADPRFQTVLDQVKKEFRDIGIDPDLIGWRGLIEAEAKKRLR